MADNDNQPSDEPAKPSRLNLSKYKICAAPKFKKDEIEQLTKENPDKQLNLRKAKELHFNPEYSQLEEAESREQEELRAEGKLIKKNTLTGYVEMTNLSEAMFEEQRRSYQSIIKEKDNIVVAPKTNKPSEEDAAVIAEYLAKRRKRARRAPAEDQETATPSEQAEQFEKAQLHIKDPYDYQGRSFLEAPRDLDGINLHSDTTPDGCRIPRTCTHTYRGHTKAITATKYFPKTAHLVLSSSLDHKVKLWELYKEKRCVMTYSGHKQGVRDICFNRPGDKFVSASYDKYLKLWDTETGQCVQRFTSNKMAYCVKFNPDPECEHLFLAGMANKKILCWDCRSGEIVQEYDRHLGAINSITFVDENRKFISSSDDKSLRVWEWDIPVDVKYIADPMLHSMPAITSAPNNKRLLCQSMDNKIQAFTCHNKFKLDSKKIFKGHMVAGYACVPDFSCDMSLVISGDADGKIFFWSWSTTKIITTYKAHDSACISVMWHPHERQKLVSAGWDNLIKIWE